MLVANATLNSYRFPYGPRPTTTARRTRATRRGSANANDRDPGRARGRAGWATPRAPSGRRRGRPATSRTSRSRRRWRTRGCRVGASDEGAAAVREQHGVADVRREADGGGDDAERRRGARRAVPSIVSRDACGPAGWFRGRGSEPGGAGRWSGRWSGGRAPARRRTGGRSDRVVGLRLKDRPQLPQVTPSRAGRAALGAGDDERPRRPSERVAPGS